MYQALYRKYRPQTFSDVCGQEHISQTLKNQVATGKISHAYLFTGSRGTGKTSTAKILSKAVNCLNNKGGDPCNECEICKGIDNGSILDIVEIDAASNRGVDDIRSIREQIEYSPAKAKFRVYIIDEVHMLTKEAFNALLKTLEEPPAHAVFILATTEVYKIPATILSRCQRYDFNRIAANIIADRINFICEKESIFCEQTAAALIAKLADGGMRDALSMLDLCAANADAVTEQSVAQKVGLVGREHLFAITDLIEQKNAAEMLKTVDELYNSSCDMERLCSELISHYRDLMVAKTTNDYEKLITATKEELTQIGKQAKQVKFENIIYCVQKLTDAAASMKSGTPKRIAIETTLIRLCNPALDSSYDALLHRVSTLEDSIKSGVLTVQPTKKAEPVSAQITHDAPPVVEQTKAQAKQVQTQTKQSAVPKAAAEKPTGNPVVFEKWAEVMERLQKVSPLIHAVMNGSTAYTDGDLLLIDAPNSQFADLIKGDSRHKDSIRKAALNITGVTYRLGPYKNDKTVVEKKQDPLDSFLNDFGDIIDVE